MRVTMMSKMTIIVMGVFICIQWDEDKSCYGCACILDSEDNHGSDDDNDYDDGDGHDCNVWMVIKWL